MSRGLLQFRARPYLPRNVHDDHVCVVWGTKFTGYAGSKYCSEDCKKQPPVIAGWLTS